jgi:hypothetical protein
MAKIENELGGIEANEPDYTLELESAVSSELHKQDVDLPEPYLTIALQKAWKYAQTMPAQDAVTHALVDAGWVMMRAQMAKAVSA